MRALSNAWDGDLAHHPVLEPPEFPVGWVDQQEQTVGIAHLAGFGPGLALRMAASVSATISIASIPSGPRVGGALELTQTHLAREMAPRFAGSGEIRRALAEQMQRENPRISGAL